jgi:predicted short-subunit dehydrogenase-like oxidoreductase (DUF2520 family)
MSEIQRIALVGSGRVATHLARILTERGVEISGIYSRNVGEAEKLASGLHTSLIKDISAPINADLILLAVSDDAIHEVASSLNRGTKAIVAHTSGAVPLSEIPEYLHRGVFYPLQSFSPDKKVNWENVPFCLEASEDDDLNRLGKLAEKLSSKIFILSSDQRKSLHLAAVFANNFANLMFEFSEELLADAGIDRSILHPLILETSHKVLLQRASKSQTGPAARGDKETIQAHRALLGEEGIHREVYDILSREIYRRNHNEEL